MTLREWIKQNAYRQDSVKVYVNYKDGHDIIFTAPNVIEADIRFVKVLDCGIDPFDGYTIDVDATKINAPIHGYRIQDAKGIKTITGKTFSDACLRAGVNPHRITRL